MGNLRTNMPNFGKTTLLTEKYFQEFLDSFDKPEEKEKLERWTLVPIEEIEKKKIFSWYGTYKR